MNVARNTAVIVPIRVDDVTSGNGLPGLTLAVTIKKAAGAFVSAAPAVTDQGNGWYDIALTAAMTDTLGPLVVRATAAGADPAERVLDVAPAVPDVNIVSIGGATITLASLVQAILTAESSIAGLGGPRSLDQLIVLLSAFAFGHAVPLSVGTGSTYYDRKADGSQGVPRFVVTVGGPASFTVSNIDVTTPSS